LETAVAVPKGSMFLDRALQRHVSFPRVYRAYCRNLGARGSARAGDMLVAAADRADSAAERRAITLLRAAGIPGWVLGGRGDPRGASRGGAAAVIAKMVTRATVLSGHVDDATITGISGRSARAQRPRAGCP
jgi:hypothetical protein